MDAIVANCRKLLAEKKGDKPVRGVLVTRHKFPDFGPGTELTVILKDLGAPAEKCASCVSFAHVMNLWGVAGCKAKRETIVARLNDQKTKRGWTFTAGAVLKAVTTGLAFSINPLDPIGSIVDEAIRRAEVKEAAAAEPKQQPKG